MGNEFDATNIYTELINSVIDIFKDAILEFVQTYKTELLLLAPLIMFYFFMPIVLNWIMSLADNSGRMWTASAWTQNEMEWRRYQIEQEYDEAIHPDDYPDWDDTLDEWAVEGGWWDDE